MSSLIGDLKYLVQNRAEVNVVDSQAFHKRICEVFDEISTILQRSAGPCGAPAVISNMPSYHITKDGYTIAKNIMYDNYKGYLDQVITYMITDVCERLNNTVGDGTTAAILCTNAMYHEITLPEVLTKIHEMFFLPRDILYRMQRLKVQIIDELMRSARNIKDLPLEEMVSAISEVVFISSNGNLETTNMIADAYRRIGAPAIRVETADNGITRCEITEGFEFKAQLIEKAYINSDTGVLSMDNVSVLMFDSKMDSKTFQYVVVPTLQGLKQAYPGQRLLVLAPSYDSHVLRTIAPSLTAELAATGSITLVLAVYPNATADARKTADDFSMLANTFIITEMKVDDIRKRQIEMISEIKNAHPDGDDTGNPNWVESKVLAHTAKYILGLEIDTCGSEFTWPTVGHVDHAKMGWEASSFSGFHYNQNRYNVNMMDAERNYKDAVDQYRITGSFNFDIDDCLARISRLKLKTAVIYVGSDTEFSTKFDKDAMDDAVRAAQSAYFNGTVIGKHVSVMRAIKKVCANTKSGKDKLLLTLMLHGFRSVNNAIMENGFGNDNLFDGHTVCNIDSRNRYIAIKGRNLKVTFPDKDAFDQIHKEMLREKDKDSGMYAGTIFDFITEYEIRTGTVLDLNVQEQEDGEDETSILTFNTAVVNSSATDREILTAAIDLVGLLLTSNQLIIAKPNT